MFYIVLMISFARRVPQPLGPAVLFFVLSPLFPHGSSKVEKSDDAHNYDKLYNVAQQQKEHGTTAPSSELL